MTAGIAKSLKPKGSDPAGKEESEMLTAEMSLLPPSRPEARAPQDPSGGPEGGSLAAAE